MGKLDADAKEAKKRYKEMETPEEKRERRLKKKRAKYGDDWQPPVKTAEEFGYDEKDNRFGDTSLGEQFTWHKKIDDMVKKGEDPRSLTDPKMQKRRKQELKEEITKLKARREEREKEKIEMEEERDRLNREREMLEHVGWEKKEDAFHLEMAKERTKIRLKENRARPIDMLAKNFLLDENFDMEMSEPYRIFRGLPEKEIQDLKEGIQHHFSLGDHVDYWAALMVVCDDELEKHRSDREAALRGDHGINHAVSDDINTMFQGKSSSELEDLDSQINANINSGEVQDIEYWTNLLKRLTVHKAKAKLREVHADLLQQRLRKLTDNGESGFDEDGQLDKQAMLQKESTGPKSAYERAMDAAKDRKDMPPPSEAPSGQVIIGGVVQDVQDEDAEDGGWSPVLERGVDEEEMELVVEAEDDEEELYRLRQAVSGQEAKGVDQRLAEGNTAKEDALFNKEMAKASEDQEAGEVAFDDTADTGGAEQYWWHDKYRPRKPRYFNRVHTGYEWNKYNQTHYDHDNPPPKVVQGYKFNIFYPDLIDKAKAPEFHINPDPDGNPELCVIRFSAGPPYEDIAFKVVNREWEYSHKKGYKCTFDRGILHLFFNFKRHRYRR